VAYTVLGGLLHAVLGRSSLDLTAALLTIPLSMVFLAWTGRVLSAERLPWRALVPFAVGGAALLALYSVGARVYVPHLFSTYATRYGVIGAVFALISALFCFMFIIVVAAAAGREVHDELERIRRGEKPADDEVRRQWAEITDQLRSHWDTVRLQVAERRRRRGGK
jgi:membrane protein